MLGAIIGDIAGSIYEWDPQKTTEMPLFEKGSFCTDDSMMTVAVAQALIDTYGETNMDKVHDVLVRSMKYWGLLYPTAGYGSNFATWLRLYNDEAYQSYGNGSAMRVSSVGWLYPTLAKTVEMAKVTADVTHNHPEGVKGAQSVAAAIFLARHGKSKVAIKKFISENTDYDLDRKVNEIRPGYLFDVTCQGSVPEAIICFLEGSSFEEVIRLAISLGGDSDTQAAIAGSIAEAFYGIPDEIVNKASQYIPEPLLNQVQRFYRFANELKNNGYQAPKKYKGDE